MTSEVVFAVANLTIFVGYLFIGFVIVPNIAVRLMLTKVGGFFFFATCGLTHLELAVHSFVDNGLPRGTLTAGHMQAIHVVQAFAIVLFVTGLYREFVKPEIRPRLPE